MPARKRSISIAAAYFGSLTVVAIFVPSAVGTKADALALPKSYAASHASSEFNFDTHRDVRTAPIEIGTIIHEKQQRRPYGIHRVAENSSENRYVRVCYDRCEAALNRCGSSAKTLSQAAQGPYEANRNYQYSMRECRAAEARCKSGCERRR